MTKPFLLSALNHAMRAVLFAAAAALMSAAAQAAGFPVDPTLAAQPMTFKPRQESFVPLQKDREGLQRLRVLKKYDLNFLKSNPKFTFDDSTVDFTPLFSDHRSLSNMALRLHALPEDVDVTAENVQGYEIAEGLVVRQELSYRIQRGRCLDPAARAALAAAGAGCFVQEPAEDVARAFGRSGDVRYIADPVRRAQVIADFKNRSIEAGRTVNDKVRILRGLLAAPQSRKIYLDAVGPAEVQRMENLSDEQLKDEMINSGEVHIQQTLFIPRAKVVQRSRFDIIPPLDAPAGTQISPRAQSDIKETVQDRANATAAITGATMSPRVQSEIKETVQDRANAKDVLGTKTTDVDLQQYIYLTGFTLSDDWQWEVTGSFTINWCLAAGLFNPLAALSALVHSDCTPSYYVEPHAGFGYGFGLRFPITTSGHYERRVHPDNQADAKVRFDFTPINGLPDDYLATGLPAAQVFNGQELVAQVYADAGFGYKLPVIGSNDLTTPKLTVDFTQFLPVPFREGQFPPPKPGETTGPAHFIFEQVDLLGGAANVALGGAKAFPMVDVSLVSDGLTFTLSDQIDRAHPVDTLLQHNGQTVPIGVEPGGGHNSRFSLKDPTYNLAFLLTPGVDARLYVTLEIWSHDWDFPIMFPQIAVKLPPDGVTFTCHANTQCHRDFYTPGDLDPDKAVKQKIE